MAVAGDTTVRLQAADAASCFSSSSPAIVGWVLSLLLADQTLAVRTAANHGLSQFLHRLGGTARLSVIMEWTQSSDRVQRAAIASALSENGAMVGCAGAVIALARDPCREVRYAAAQTASSLLESNPARYRPVLETLAQDQCPSVRLIARDRLALGS
jgi:hypothetical protein